MAATWMKKIVTPGVRGPTAEPVCPGERVGRCRITKKAVTGVTSSVVRGIQFVEAFF